MRQKSYDRDRAVAYAHRWAYERNPRYYNFDNLGGDCTNFASQVVYAGAGVMNTSGETGWYYRSLNDRSPSWTGVEYFYRFMVLNRSIGPEAEEAELSDARPGDAVQLSFDGLEFHHTPMIVTVGAFPTVHNVLVSAHTLNSDNRPLDSYIYEKMRVIHIKHVNIR